ncbi:MAG: amino acid ABC transporter permease, partial [Actinomycetota bacterium]
MTSPISDSENWQPSELERRRRAERQRKTRKNVLIAGISSVLVLGTFSIILVNSPGWISLRDTFFKWAYGVEVLPKVILGFTTNITLTLIAGSSVALLGLLLALVRTS